MRKTPFVEKEHYHIFNRGVDKRDVFQDTSGMDRFLRSMLEFNTTDPIGSIYENRKQNSLISKEKNSKVLVNFIAYCLNPNHYHFILEQVSEKGIEKFMQRIGTGYTKYFNIKNNRSGVLFQGRFKSVYIDSNEYLLHLSAYVNLNNHIDLRGSSTSTASTRSRSSWNEYISANYQDPLCKKDIVLEQFNDKASYEKFAKEALENIIERKIGLQQLNADLSKLGVEVELPQA